MQYIEKLRLVRPLTFLRPWQVTMLLSDERNLVATIVWKYQDATATKGLDSDPNEWPVRETHPSTNPPLDRLP